MWSSCHGGYGSAELNLRLFSSVLVTILGTSDRVRGFFDRGMDFVIECRALLVECWALLTGYRSFWTVDIALSTQFQALFKCFSQYRALLIEWKCLYGAFLTERRVFWIQCRALLAECRALLTLDIALRIKSRDLSIFVRHIFQGKHRTSWSRDMGNIYTYIYIYVYLQKKIYIRIYTHTYIHLYAFNSTYQEIHFPYQEIYSICESHIFQGKHWKSWSLGMGNTYICVYTCMYIYLHTILHTKEFILCVYVAYFRENTERADLLVWEIFIRVYIYIYAHRISHTKKLIERNLPPRGGFLFTMFPDPEPCVRDFTTRCDGRISSWNLLHTALDQGT